MPDLAQRARGARGAEAVAHAEAPGRAEHSVEAERHSFPIAAATAVAVADRADDEGPLTRRRAVQLAPTNLPAAPRLQLGPGSLPGRAGQLPRLLGVHSGRQHLPSRDLIHESRSTSFMARQVVPINIVRWPHILPCSRAAQWAVWPSVGACGWTAARLRYRRPSAMFS